MTSDRHLALMALMTELEGPTNSYRHAVRQAARQITDSPDFNATVARGNRALDDIEQAVRLWVATHPSESDAVTPAGQLDELLPAWEAMYEPGNVSDYLIGYANHQDAATGAAEAWLRSQAEVTGRLEWVPQNPHDGYDTEFELIERHDDGIDTGPGITVRHRAAASA